MTPRFPRLLAAALFIVCVVWPCSLEIEAQGKKGKASASRSRGKSSKRSSGRSLARRSKKGRRSTNQSQHDLAFNSPSNYPVVPDRIEVLEHGSSSSTDMAQYLNLPAARSQQSQNNSEPVAAATSRRRKVKIEASRVLQIQQALANRGFYSGEMTGVYDEATIDAMRRFQASEKIAATGYPTAHALKRLGLAN